MRGPRQVIGDLNKNGEGYVEKYLPFVACNAPLFSRAKTLKKTFGIATAQLLKKSQ